MNDRWSIEGCLVFSLINQKRQGGQQRRKKGKQPILNPNRAWRGRCHLFPKFPRLNRTHQMGPITLFRLSHSVQSVLACFDSFILFILFYSVQSFIPVSLFHQV